MQQYMILGKGFYLLRSGTDRYLASTLTFTWQLSLLRSHIKNYLGGRPTLFYTIYTFLIFLINAEKVEKPWKYRRHKHSFNQIYNLRKVAKTNTLLNKLFHASSFYCY